MSKKVEENKSFHCKELLWRDNELTPDYLDRKLEKYIPVFVYGTLKTGGRFHHVLSDAPCLGDAYTVTEGYEMRQSTSFPVVFSRPGKKPGRHYVYGEVYIVNASVLLELDRIEGNNEMFKRETRWVWLLDQSLGKGKRPAIRPWIYLGLDDYWSGIPTLPVASKKMGTVEIFEWEQPKTAMPYAPKSTVKPEAKYVDPYGRDTMWDDHYQDDAMFWQDYDEERAKKNRETFNDQIPWDIM